jgi:hypothetical protein
MSSPDSPAGQAYINIAANIKGKLFSAPCDAFAKQPTISIS